jgi:hypothetical protein
MNKETSTMNNRMKYYFGEQIIKYKR